MISNKTDKINLISLDLRSPNQYSFWLLMSHVISLLSGGNVLKWADSNTQ